MSREQAVSAAFVELADTLTTDFDMVDYLHTLTVRCVDLLSVDAAGIMVTDHRGNLRVMASSAERIHLIELLEIESAAGPCVECFATGQSVSDNDLHHVDPRWANFSRHASDAGFRAAHALPMRLREEPVGVLNLFTAHPGPMAADDVSLGQALADVTTIGLLQQRALHQRDEMVGQLQHALNSRIVIEQAKGMLFESLKIDMHDAFSLLRAYARRTNRRLSDVAGDIVEDRLDPRAVQTPSRQRR
ncbi:transcriptional regulator [Actinoplanes sp. OR16]|uniref:GAF and ANTAR domain-containing protein n=1 Tax=Actinoplanes sp. OR16 TaxID=946334 RepID=UPI000F6CE18D|nr:GAF and ANTAR domain-containing protein [Actinoplanes sp. OR16]BBH65292.1 transcriptional regulator [Actinoplanes sp. OR16]